MSPRPYRLGRREASVVQTRARILAAAQALLGVAGFHEVSVEAVARQADVSRKTIYYHFGSKRGLIDAVVTDLEQQAEVVARVRAIVEQPDVRSALPDYMREVCRFWKSAQGVMRSLSALAALDGEVAEVLVEHDAARRRRLVAFVARLAEQGQMTTRVSPERIVDTLWMLTSFGAFDHLVQRSAMPVEEAAEILITLAQGVLPD
jgi:AcrR family transcriptional regulator